MQSRAARGRERAVSFICGRANTNFLTARSAFLMSGGGTPLPNERLLSGRIDHGEPMPGVRPAVPHFSSGPCAKRPGWTLQALKDALLGRSHRSKGGKAKLKRAIEVTREVLEVPADFRIGIVPASDTGAVEMAMWSMLGRAAGHHDRLGILRRRLGDRRRQAAQAQGRDRHQGALRRAAGPLQGRSEADIVFTWNGTTSGVRVPNADWIAADREGVTICDATSAAFAQPLDWAKARCRDLLLAEGARRRGRARHADPLAARGRAAGELHAALAAAEDLPHDQGRQAQRGIFEGETINTPSMLCVEDYLDTLAWAKSVGGLKGLMARADANAKVIHDWVDEDAVDREPRRGSDDALQHVGLPEDRRSGGHGAAGRRAMGLREGSCRADREGGRGLRHREASRRAAGPAHLVRCTVERSDVEALTPWLDWAFAQAKAALPKAAYRLRLSPRKRGASSATIPALTAYQVLFNGPARSHLRCSFARRRADLQGSRRRGRFPAQARRRQGEARRADRRLRRPRDPLGHQGDAEDPRAGEEPEGDRPRRHRRRQCRHPGGDRQGHHRDEHALRQFDHHRRARDHPDAGARAPDPAGRRLDAGRQVGEEPLHGRRDHRQDARRDRLRQYRLDRRRPRARPAHAGDRLRSVPVAGARRRHRRAQGRARRAVPARRLHHAAHAAHREDQEHHRRRGARAR